MVMQRRCDVTIIVVKAVPIHVGGLEVGLPPLTVAARVLVVDGMATLTATRLTPTNWVITPFPIPETKEKGKRKMRSGKKKTNSRERIKSA